MPRNAPILIALSLAAAPVDAQPVRDGERVRRALGEDLRDGLVLTGQTPHRLLLFTFDDGPRDPYTADVLDLLDRFGVRAVFFVNGYRLSDPRHADLLREAVRRGHMIGNHTQTHPNFGDLSSEEVADEIDEGAASIERVLGERPWLLRPPGGAQSPRIHRIAAERGYTTVLWSLGGQDWRLRRTDLIVRAFFRRLDFEARIGRTRGGVVAMHDTSRYSVEAFEQILEELLARNCELLADPAQELYDFAPDPRPFFQPRGEAPVSQEAAPARIEAGTFARRQAALRDATARRCGAP